MSAHGPNVNKLIIQFIAREAIPPGGNLGDGMKFLTDPEYRKQVLEKAERYALNAIQLIKTAPDNPYGNDDEQIAGWLLTQIEEAKNDRYHRHPTPAR